MTIRILLGNLVHIGVCVLSQIICLSQFFKNLSLQVFIRWTHVLSVHCTLIRVIDHNLVSDIIDGLAGVRNIVIGLLVLPISFKLGSYLVEITFNGLYVQLWLSSLSAFTCIDHSGGIVELNWLSLCSIGDKFFLVWINCLCVCETTSLSENIGDCKYFGRFTSDTYTFSFIVLS